MRARGVIASARGDVIRLAPHFYSTFDDVDQALDALATVLRDERSRMTSTTPLTRSRTDRARDVRVALRRDHHDDRRRARPRERVALPVHGRALRRRGVRAVLRARRARDRRAGPDGRVGVRQAYASWDGGGVRACRTARPARPSAGSSSSIVVAATGVLHERHRLGAVLRRRRDRARACRSRSTPSAVLPPDTGFSSQITAAADGVHRRQ